MPANTTVFVVSDHGMHAKQIDLDYDSDEGGRPERDSGGHGSGPPGVIVVAGPAVRRAEPGPSLRELTRADLPEIGDVVDITPTILALRGVPIGRDMDGAILERHPEARGSRGSRSEVHRIARHARVAGLPRRWGRCAPRARGATRPAACPGLPGRRWGIRRVSVDRAPLEGRVDRRVHDERRPSGQLSAQRKRLPMPSPLPMSSCTTHPTVENPEESLRALDEEEPTTPPPTGP